MKRYLIVLFLLALPIACSAQFLGIGAQYADAKGGNDIQFAANASYPAFKKKNKLNAFIASGIDYTGGSSPVAGLNIKPFQGTTFLSESLFNNYPGTIMMGGDAGYLFNFKHGKDGIVLTPNLYLDYKCFFIKTGYDFNVTGGENQFFVRFGIAFGMGTLKMLPNTKIW